ncbi:ParA family protein [Sphingomonas sp. VNH70]|uniref:ParA family protein n=1 Tax=Sphingomonas silueang TaxID=3156617 RepID=UPI0032B60565
MPVITIAQSKGGAGKTTLTLALASEYAAMGGSVIILDADRQKSMMNWQNDRVEAGRGVDDGITVVDVSDIQDKNVGAAIVKARSQANLVIIDSEGTANFKSLYACQDSDYVVVPTRSSRLDLERTVETAEMLQRMCKGVPFRVLITQTAQVARSKTELEIDRQIAQAFPAFEDRMHTLDAFRAMSNYRMTLAEVEEAGLAKCERARSIAQNILVAVLEEIKTKEGVDA